MEWIGRAILAVFWIVILLVTVTLMVTFSPLLIYEEVQKKRMQPKCL